MYTLGVEIYILKFLSIKFHTTIRSRLTKNVKYRFV